MSCSRWFSRSVLGVTLAGGLLLTDVEPREAQGAPLSPLDDQSQPTLRAGAAAALPSAFDGRWMELDPPSPLTNPAGAYDPLRLRMIVFGGSEESSPNNEVWSLSLLGPPTWSRIAPTGTPPAARFGHTAIYDPVRNRIVIHGGANGSHPYFTDTWALSLADPPAWTELSPSGTPPPGVMYHTAVYDPDRDEMVVFGGIDGAALHNEVWTLSFSGTPAWSQLTPTGAPPSARYWHTAIYDPSRARMVIFGGHDVSYSDRNDLWALTRSEPPEWSLLSPSGSLPAPRRGQSAVYDSQSDRMIMFGGFGSEYHNDAWGLSLSGTTAWNQLSPSGSLPAGRSSHVAVYDPVEARMVVFAGNDASSRRNDLWTLSTAETPTWTELSTVMGPPPPSRSLHTAIFDPLRNRMVIFAGYDGTNRDDLWILTLAGMPTWSQVPPSSWEPSGRHGHCAVCDPVGDRMVCFGGYDGHYLKDVWQYRFGPQSWGRIFTSTTPMARCYAAAVYDPPRNQMVVYGGMDSTSAYLGDAWKFSLGSTPSWSQLFTVGPAPPPRCLHSAIYDQARDRIVIFGGFGSSPAQLLNDVWTLTLSGTPQWSAIVPSGTLPPGLYGHSAIYDPERDRMVVFGGFDASNDAWALSFSDPPTWSHLAPSGVLPSHRGGHAAVYEPAGDRMVVFGGSYYFGSTQVQPTDTWALTWAPEPTGIEDGGDHGGPSVHHEASGLYALEGSVPNPFTRRTTIRFEIPEPTGQVALDIYDLEGRLVRNLLRASVSRGSHALSWDGCDEQGRLAPSGVYFCRMEANGIVRAVKIVCQK